MDWEDLFKELASFMLNISSREGERNERVAESVLITIQSYIRVINAIRETLEEAVNVDEDFSDTLHTVEAVLIDMEEVHTRWVLIEAGVSRISGSYQYPRVVRTGNGLGRPTVVIGQDKIEFLRELKFSWTDIASMFGVSRRTLYNIRTSYGMLGGSQLTTISDDDLCEHIRRIGYNMPDVGCNMLRGLLRAEGVHVSIPRIRQCVHEIDPVNNCTEMGSTCLKKGIRSSTLQLHTAFRWQSQTNSVRYSTKIWVKCLC